MSRSATVALIALVIAGYAVYTALYLPGMLVGPPMPLLVIAFVAQVGCGLIAAAGLWTHRHWAAVAVGLFAASIVATQLIEVLLGITPYLRAVLIGALAVIGALLLAAYTNRSPQAE